MVKFFDETDGIGVTIDYTFNSLVRVVARLKEFEFFFKNHSIASLVRTLFLNYTHVFLQRASRAIAHPGFFVFGLL